MFERTPSMATRLAEVDDAALIDVIAGAAREEAAGAARRWAAVAALTDRRCHSELAEERQYWACDAWDSAAAEIAATLTISHRSASKQMHQGLALCHRLPRVAALLAAGAISASMAETLTWRAHLVDDPEVLAAVDADLATIIDTWGRLAPAKLQSEVDALIDRHDPAAVLAHHTAARGRDVQLGKRDDVTGTTSLWGRLLSTDGEVANRRLDEMARSVCDGDPRSLGERRSDAMGILMAGGQVLPCRCEQPDCSRAGEDARADAIVIHVLTNRPPDGPTGPAEPPDDDPGPADPPPPCPPSAVTTGGVVIPIPLLAELRRIGAAIRTVPTADSLGAETGYRPSTLLARFVRTRDMTCCYPGCDRPAERCDLDHTVSYATSRLTHPGNVKTLCRKHHLLKTFWVGAGGWHDEQLADGTVIWTAPTGHRYRSPPGSRIRFPEWDTITSTPPISSVRLSPAGERGLAMPVRHRPRAAENAARIRRERRRNQDVIDANPPPF